MSQTKIILEVSYDGALLWLCCTVLLHNKTNHNNKAYNTRNEKQDAILTIFKDLWACAAISN